MLYANITVFVYFFFPVVFCCYIKLFTLPPSEALSQYLYHSSTMTITLHSWFYHRHHRLKPLLPLHQTTAAIPLYHQYYHYTNPPPTQYWLNHERRIGKQLKSENFVCFSVWLFVALLMCSIYAPTFYLCAYL